MLSQNNSTVVDTTSKNTTSLFTAGGLKLNTNTQAQSGQMIPAQPKYQVAAQMSMGGPSMRMPTQLQASVSKNESSSFFGTPAPVMSASTNSYNSLQATPSVPKQQVNMSMFGGAPQKSTFEVKQTPLGGSLGNSVNMSKAAYGRTGTVMMAAPVTDSVSLQQKFDNTDHLDPVLHYEGNKFVGELMENAKKLSSSGKGILASDESNGTCGKRFEAIGVENTEQNRNDYRELLYTVEGLEKFVSGAIMYDETIRQNASDGKSLVKTLGDKGILTGIKVDTGISLIEGTNDETVTNGLDGLSERASEYYAMGARFAKWRAVLKITDDGCPSEAAIKETAHSLARYAAICQHAGLVPIVEPEILSDGTHDIKTCARVSEKVFTAVMNAVVEQRVWLEGMLLKPNMITSGAQCEVQAGPEEVAFFTVRTLARSIPPAVPGITFLSGGQSEEIASQNLNAINQLAEVKHPWNMTYSFGRALQSSVLTTWGGKKENVKDAQQRLYERCESCSQAALGKYTGGSGSTTSDYVANYVY